MSDRTRSYAAQEAGRRDDMAVVVSTIDKQEKKYQDILPSNVRWGDFRNAFLVAIQGNPRLLDADRQSLWLALQKAAGDGLKPDGRESALVIFGDDQEDEDGNPIVSQAKGKKKVVYMPMVAGLIKLVRNTGNVANIRAKLIYRGERVIITDEDGKEGYRHVREIDVNSEIDDSPANIIGAYAVINYKDGFWEMEAMTARQIGRVRAVSRSKKGPWLAWADEMAKKTVLRRLIKRLDKSAELRRIDDAITHDETMGVQIEGERPTEIMEEFSAEKQGANKSLSNGHDEPRQETTDKPDDRKRDEVSTDTSVSGFDHYAINEFGEYEEANGERLRFKDPAGFTAWYKDAYQQAADKNALREFNEAAIAEVATETGTDLAAPTQVETERKGGRQPVMFRDLPNGKIDWQAYVTDCDTALKARMTDAEIDEWVGYNQSTYKDPKASKAYALKIEKLVETHRHRIKPLGIDPREKDAADLTAQFNAVKQPHEYDALVNNPAIRSQRQRIAKDRPDLIDGVATADMAAAERVRRKAPDSEEPPWEELGESPE